MQVKTNLFGKDKELFAEVVNKEGITHYKLAKKAIMAYLENEPKEKDEELRVSGNLEEDIKTLSQSDKPTSFFEVLLDELERQGKLKNKMKKGGAFHFENAVIDIKSMLDGRAQPNYFELAYHFRWWDRVALLTNVLARRGELNKKAHIRLYDAVETRPDLSGDNSYSPYQDRVDNITHKKIKARNKEI